ncbi:MAG TPA: hypothetical protein VGO93_29175 [Candidatus Xenobia bacterium]|jgi:hypothetical protein
MAFLCVLGPAWADKAEYFETYGYATAEKGELEVELWNDFFANPAARYETEEEHGGHQISVEYGFTDHFMAEVYGVWRDDPANQGITYTNTRLELRYRLGEYNRDRINTALYLEYDKTAVADFADELEGKLIFSRDLGDWNVTGNAVFVHDLVPGSPLEFQYALGVNHPIGKHMLGSLETYVAPMDHQVFIIPSIHFPLSKKVYAGFGIDVQTSPTPVNATLRTFVAQEF